MILVSIIGAQVLLVFGGSSLRAGAFISIEAQNRFHRVSRLAPLEEWMDQEKRASIEGLEMNLSPLGTAPGVVTASPSRSDPDYYYHWVRDASLVAGIVLDLYERTPDQSDRLRYLKFLESFVEFSRKNQLTPNLSGGLGEPKFHVDGSAFTSEWGRPQNDGPALRAVTLIRFARLKLAQGESSWVRSVLYDGQIPTHSVIKADLEFISHHWMEPSFDLWEEVRGQHFYTRMVQRRALWDGANLAEELKDFHAASWYRQQARELEKVILEHWDESRRVFVATLDRSGGIASKISGLDVAVILGCLHGDRDDAFLRLSDDRVLSTAQQMKEVFQKLYRVNPVQGLGPAIGRYPEDMYDGHQVVSQGGNPWVLATLALGEFSYRVAQSWQKEGRIQITELNLPFLRSLAQDQSRSIPLKPGVVILKTDPQFQEWIELLKSSGDLYLKRIQYHAPSSGRLSEQMNRDTGYMQGARDLAWSYASFLSAFWERQKL